MNTLRKQPVLTAIMIVLAAFLFLRLTGEQNETIIQLPTSALIARIVAHEVAHVSIRGNVILALSKNGKVHTRTYTGNPSQVREVLIAHPSVQFDETPPADDGWFMSLLPTILMVAFAIWIFRSMSKSIRGAGGPLAVGKSKAKLISSEKADVRFTDVAGNEAAIHELSFLVKFLKDPTRHGRLGARVPKGTLLEGPPGTGKTLLARAVAGEAGVPFFSVKGSEFVEMFVGVGAARIRDLFEQAQKLAPCIIFFDEFDAVASKRSIAGGYGGHDEREQTLMQLLAELDGFSPMSGVIILAASNRPDSLDPAVTRAGRFDRRIVVDRPDRAARTDILRLHARKLKMAPGIDYAVIAKMTPGFVGADMENLLNEATILATNDGSEEVTQAHCIQAIERVMLGSQGKGKLMSPKEREIIAWHEAGHATVGHFLPDADPVQKVTIIGRGRAAGYTISVSDDERMLMQVSHLKTLLKVLYGGREAEKLLLGSDDFSTGASDDYDRATDLAHKMVTRFGMAPELGDRTFGTVRQSFLGSETEANYSQKTAEAIDGEVMKITSACKEGAMKLLTLHRDKLEALAKVLLEEETVDDVRLAQILGPRPTA